MRWSVQAQDVCDSGIETDEVARFTDRADAVAYAKQRNAEALLPSSDERRIFYVLDNN